MSISGIRPGRLPGNHLFTVNAPDTRGLLRLATFRLLTALVAVVSAARSLAVARNASAGVARFGVPAPA
jgi:hypothetical protein